MLLRVWSRLTTRLGEKLPPLVLVGRWGWRVDAVQRLLQSDAALANKVRIYPYLPDAELVWLYRNALFSVFPSLAEGWGLGAAESLDFGTPVIIAEVPPLREATQDLMPAIAPSDEAAWEQQIAGLLGEPGRVADLRKRALTGYRRRTPADMFADLAALF
jgi:glycosyltransferase involved in cell wall biosynthesis